MKKEKGFSLAEALITLLIVCVIAIATAPILTKKAKKPPKLSQWQNYSSMYKTITPSNNQDILLGSQKEPERSIVIDGTLYFKNTKGHVIGWIKEDGTSSFTQNYELMLQEQQKVINQIEGLIDEVRMNQESYKKYDNYYKTNRRTSNHDLDASQKEINRLLQEMMKNKNN